jgi:hypothetical protein
MARPKVAPTAEQRAKVFAFAQGDVPQEEIALLDWQIGKTLRLHLAPSFRPITFLPGKKKRRQR